MGVLMWTGARLVPLALCFLVLASPAHAQPSSADRARSLANRGFELFQEGRYEEANAHFREAEQLFHAPTLLRMIARTYEKQHKLADALMTYRRVVSERLDPGAPSEFAKAQHDAQDELRALVPRVPYIEVALSDPARAHLVTVKVDGAAVPRITEPIPVNPGSHQVEVTAVGSLPFRDGVTLAEGERKQIRFVVSPTDRPSMAPAAEGTPPASPYVVPMVAAFGAGGVGLIVGTVAGVAALGKQRDLEAACPTKVCFPADEDIADAATRWATVSTVGFVVGGLGVGLGVTFVVLDQLHDGGEATSLAIRAGLGSVSLEGSF